VRGAIRDGQPEYGEYNMSEDNHQQRLAVLIDADNAHPNIIEALFSELAKYGTTNVKRIYGDWTNPHLKGWKEVLLAYAIQPIQQFAYTSGKNSTDSALIIDAMDLLYSGKVDAFCIVSSDSDFTRLASRIREAELKVYGFGEKKTPKAFVAACDKFIYTEILREQDEDVATPKKPINKLKGDTRLLNLLRNAVDSTADETGWAHLAAVGSIILGLTPDFDARNYGYKKLSELMSATECFEIQLREVTKTGGKAHFVRFTGAKKG
jgi:uncharacterized LabA/DUF88 family protein